MHKWKDTSLPERPASVEHFLDLCRLLGQPSPATVDKTGAEYTFEKGGTVSGSASAGSKGERGFADVWWRGKFGWEYKRKGKYKDLTGAYRQLLQYREALSNPPLLIVSDISRTEIHTNFTGTAKEVHTVLLEDMAEPRSIDLLRRVFTDPGSFRPRETTEQVTERAAKEIGLIAHGLRQRGHDPHDAAHFLMKVMFCLFAEDVELLPKGIFERLLDRSKRDPARLKSQMDTLFAAMRTGGDFGVEEIAYFNGGLFDEAGAIELTVAEIGSLVSAAGKDWGSVEPSVFGTLFERSLDPDKRAQIGAHYTSKADIMLVIEPVIVRPLRREWEVAKAGVADQLERRRAARTKATKDKADREIADLLDGFQHRLSSVRVLDPACGSGNFLYVAIQQLLLLEKEVIAYASEPEIGQGLIPRVRPTQLHGIEINPYAAELAQVVIWIGYLQWMRDNGFNAPRDPILEPIETIENRDAILSWLDEGGKPIPAWREGATCAGQAKWPEADYVVGNPPFLGAKLFRQYGLGEGYIEAMYEAFRLPRESDLCCYWFAKGSSLIERLSGARFGLLATQAIRNASNRAPLEAIIGAGGVIFDAWSDREWILDGAAVHVSIICFARAREDVRLDGRPTPEIHADLSVGVSLLDGSRLEENAGVYVRSPEKGGNFEIDHASARRILSSPNPNGRSALDVLSRWVNANGLTKTRLVNWIIDFHVCDSQSEASVYSAAYAHLERTARTSKSKGRTPTLRKNWWKFRRTGEGVRDAQRRLNRVLATSMVAKHRLFAWIDSDTQPDKTIPVFARSDDYFFGVLHSSVHELWARRQGTQLREAESGFRYTPTTCFETFPLPWPPGAEPAIGHPHRPLHDAIAAAAATLNEQRERWLNPPEWVAAIATKIDAEDDFADVAAVSGEEARRLIRQSAIDAASAADPRLKKRTLTNLYNERPTWLRLAHKALDEAVLAAYAAVDPATEGPAWNPAWAEVFEPTGAGQPLPDGHPLTEQRAEVEQAILANLLRMNLARAERGDD